MVERRHAWCCCRRVIWGLIALLVSGCGQSPSVPTAAEQSTAIEWYGIDRRLPRGDLARYNRWFGDGTRARLVAAREAIAYDAAADSLGLEEFAARSQAEQRGRRREATDLAHRAAIAIADRGYKLPSLQQSPLNVRDSGTYRDLDAVMGRVLTRLHTAVGLDPGHVQAWYDLAFFGDIIGDVVTASRARQVFVAQVQDTTPEATDRLCRAVLDEAWFLREEGWQDRCRLWLDAHQELLSSGRAPYRGLEPSVERDLIRGLLAAEEGDLIAARYWINRLPRVAVREGLQERESSYLRAWVHVWAGLHTDDWSKVTQYLSHLLLSPLHSAVGWRYWQDMGQAAETVGHRQEALTSWGAAMRLRPFLGFFPQTAMHGPVATLGCEGTDAPYVIAYRTHYLAGSLWGYAATRALFCQVHPPQDEPRLWQETLQALDRCVRRGIHPGEARLLRARLNLQRGLTDEAAADLRDVAVDRLTGGGADGEVAFLRGVSTLNGGDLNGAIPLLQRATELDPRSVRPWQALAVCLSYLGRDEEAQRAFDATVSLAPRDGSALFNRGLFHMQQGRSDLAERDLLAAAEILPDNTRAVHLLQAVATGREVVVDKEPTPIVLIAADSEVAQAEALASLMADESGDVAAMLGDTPQEQELWLALLARRYADQPEPDARRKLAEALAVVGDHPAVQELLSAAWPDGLTARERLLLLQADRTRGDDVRARSLATADPAVMDPALVVTAVTLLHDVGAAELARALLTDARSRWPDDEALSELAIRLP